MNARSRSIPILVMVAGLAAIASLGGWLVLKALRSEDAPLTSLPAPSRNQSASEEAGTSAPVLGSIEALDVRKSFEDPQQNPISDAADKCRIEELRAKMEGYAATEKWSETYAAFSWADLWNESDSLEKAMKQTTTSAFAKRFETGQYEVVGSNGTYTWKNANSLEISTIRSGPDGHWLKVVLPEAEFQAEYKLKAQIQWLREESRRRKGSRSRVTRRTRPCRPARGQRRVTQVR